MNYKDLLDRYKKGQVSEEEKQLIEEELEKQEAFEDYISQALDEVFNDIDDIGELEIHDEETVKLKKSVNSKLRKVVVKSVLIIALLYISIFYGVSGIINGIYYDPTSVNVSEKQEHRRPNFYFDMQAYGSLNKPGYSINSFTFQDQKGFGNYETMYSMKNLFTKDEGIHFMNISRGRLSYGIDGIFGTKSHFLFEGFQTIQHAFSEETSEDTDPGWAREIQRNNEETIRYLKELNPLSYISMSIVFQNDLTMEEFWNMSNEDYPSIDFKWLGIRTNDPTTKPMYLIGFNPSFTDEGSHSQRPDAKKYPLFYLYEMRQDESLAKLSRKDFPKAISQAYEIHFKSRLEYLKDRKQFVDMFDFKTDFYKDALKYIDDNGVKTYGVLAFAKAEDFLAHIEDIPYETIYINNVLATKPNIYYSK